MLSDEKIVGGAIACVDKQIVTDAWERIKKKLEELAQQTHNSKSMPCQHDLQWSSISKTGVCKKCGARIRG